jgi:Leucine-rich repeat (LRR) protein
LYFILSNLVPLSLHFLNAVESEIAPKRSTDSSSASLAILEPLDVDYSSSDYLPVELWQSILKLIATVELMPLTGVSKSWRERVYASVVALDGRLFNRLTDDELALFSNLKTLFVGERRQDEHPLSDASVSRLTSLTSLALPYNHTITNAAVSRLANLRALKIDGCSSVTNACLSTLTSLTSLELRFNTVISDEGIAGLTNLTRLDLDTNEMITDAGISALTKLLTLSLSTFCTQVRVDGVGLCHLTNLTELSLSNN